MKQLLIGIASTIWSVFAIGQLKSPSAFLGYELGSSFTPHYKIVQYFQYVQQTLPQQVQLQEYGKTYEGRPLYLAFLSSNENMAKLEQIRINNLQLTGMETGQPNNKNTAIVWLSYNVHGNEASSSEAAMQTLFELLQPTASKWLNNTVVIIDPCLNPDGRDRYVNWFNSVVGKEANAATLAREHDEPWPGGRTNHYNFDLNRDWAWQVQTETQQRMLQYNRWMPQVHVDYHEQGYNEPYYFAPAAEPFHEAVTPWQRSFQTLIGKNNARYFDKNGWLYFTKERFDLFYPSYGDTYPTYNGSVGMTYEQGGHSRGGLAVHTDEGDILTLKDRLWHHTTTGLSTVEASSENAGKLISQFKQYFTDAQNGIGSFYKTYLLSSNDYGRIKAIEKILASNNIRYTSGPIGQGLTGYDYYNGKTGPIVPGTYTIIVNAAQPQGHLAKVLLEPVSKLTDSATYDITAWSLPYAYGVNAYALSSSLKGNEDIKSPYSPLATVSYGIIISYSNVHDAGLLAALLKNKAGVRINEKDLVYNGKKISKGSLILLKRDNTNWGSVEKIINEHGASYTLLEGGFMDSGPDMGSPDILKLAAPRIACLTGPEVNSNAAGEVWHLFEQQLHYPITMVNSSGLRIGQLNQIDVLIMPDGNYELINDKKAAEDLKNWVRAGGRIIALESTVSQLAGADWGPKLKKSEEDKKDDSDYTVVRKYENRERDDLVNSIPGAIYKVEMDDSHPLGFGLGKNFYTLKQNSLVIEFMKEGWNVGIVKNENKVSGFAGNVVKSKIKDGTLFAVQDLGRGKIIYLVDNPLFRSFWENGKLLFLNAVFMVGNEPIRL